MTEEEKKAQADAEALAKAKKEADEKALSQDPIKAELKRQEEKKAYSEQEKAVYNLKKHADRVKELGVDPLSLLGGKEEEPSEEIPEWYKKVQAKESQQTAIQMADELSDPDEKALAKQYLQSRIVPSGDANDDFRMAISAVRALKNKQILEDVVRRSNPRMTASGGSSPSSVEQVFTPTPEEKYMMDNFKVSKEKILEVRKKDAAKQK